MQHGSIQLKDWQKRQGMNEREAARKLGVHFTTYNRFIIRVRMPSRRLAITIQDITGIPVAAWTDTVVVKRNLTAKQKGHSKQYFQAGNAQ